MKLNQKKDLIARTLKVGKDKVVLVQSRLNEIKEAITKQDIRDLQKDDAILIKPKKGRKTNINKKRKRGPGKIKKKVNKRKQEYVKMTRKLRKYTLGAKKNSKINKEEYKEIRKKIRNRVYKSKNHLKNYIENLTK